jgi:hypothetical protein
MNTRPIQYHQPHTYLCAHNRPRFALVPAFLTYMVYKTIENWQNRDQFVETSQLDFFIKNQNLRKFEKNKFKKTKW